MIIKPAKVEMTFEKNENIKQKILDWENVEIKETKKFYKVIVQEDSMFECYFNTLSDHISTRSFANNYNPNSR